MRMTNKIMQRNSLYNINQTKISEDKYNTQLTSQSKITRPSDDPVIAIRALRLRSNVSTASQYYEKNAPDANQWLDVTAKSLDTITKVYTDLYKQVETGVNKDYTASDMQVLLTQIESYTNEVYATGNQDYAGRYIFTGYRTDTPLTFQKEQINNVTTPIDPDAVSAAALGKAKGYADDYKDAYNAYKDLEADASTDPADLDAARAKYEDLRSRFELEDELNDITYDADGKITSIDPDHVTASDKTKQEAQAEANAEANKDRSPVYQITESIKLNQIDSFSYTDYRVFEKTSTASSATELKIDNATLHRIRLSYDKLMSGRVFSDENGEETEEYTPSITVKDKDGNDVAVDAFATYSSAKDAYDAMGKVENGIETSPTAVYIAETGELLFTSSFASELTDVLENGGSISVTYEKNDWLVDDLNPQHYFDCTDKNTGIRYNEGGNVDTQIVYDVGYNQTIQVNTNAYEVFDPAVARDLADLRRVVDQFVEIETIRNDLKDELKGYVEGEADYNDCQRRLDAAEKAFTYVRDAVSKRFGDQITRYQTYLDNTNVAITKNGTRSTRLELISSRLEEQRSTFKELQEENEGIDMTEVAVLLTAAETTYDAALMATSKIMQNSLINYI